MKSSHVKTIALVVSAWVLIGIVVRFHTSGSRDSVLLVSSPSSKLTQSSVRHLNEKSQATVVASLEMTPLPPLVLEITPLPNTNELDETQDLRQASLALPTADPVIVAANANMEEPAQEPADLAESQNVSFAFDDTIALPAQPSSLNSTQDVQQAVHWLISEQLHDRPANAERSAPPLEFPDPTELKTELGDPDGFALASMDAENSLQNSTNTELEDSEPSSLHEDGTGRSADVPQPVYSNSEDSGGTTDQLFDQIRNQRAIAAEHEIRWSLNDAISAALIYSNRVSSLRIEPVEQLQNVGVQSGPFDVVGFSEQSFRDSTEPVGSTIDTATGVQPIVQEQDLNLVYGLRRQLRSGGEVELNQSFQIRDNDSGILVPRDQAIGRFNARVTKELLRGAGRSIAMNEVLVAFHNASAQRAESVGEIANHLNEVMTAYWDIFAARGALFASMDNRQLAAEVLRELKARQDIDAEPNLLDQAEATIRQRELQINEAHNNLVRAQIRFVSLVNAPELLENLNSIEILPQVLPDLENRGLDVSSRINTAIQRRPEIADIIEQIKSAQVINHVSLNDLLPRLSLSLEASLNGLEGDRQTAAAFRNQFENDVTYQVGASVEVPFANREARYNRRRTQLVVERLKANWQMTIEQVKAEVLDNAQAFSASQVRLEKQREILYFAGSELRYLRLRKSTAPKENSNPSFELTQLLAAQDRQGAAKAEYIAAIADKHRSIFELNRATGILVNADVIPAIGGPARPGFFSVYHQYIEERAKFSDPATALESQTRREARRSHRSGVEQLAHPPAGGVEYQTPVQAPVELPVPENPRYPLHQDYR